MAVLDDMGKPPVSHSRPIMVCQLLTGLCQAAMPSARSRGLAFLYDYVGPQVASRVSEQVLEQYIANLIGCAIEGTSSGCVVLTAEAIAGGVPQRGPMALVHVSIAGTGWRLQADEFERLFDGQVLLDREERFGDVHRGITMRRAICLASGLVMTYMASPREGCGVSLSFPAVQGDLPAGEDIDAGGAVVWILAARAQRYELLAARFERLRWHPRLFHSVGDAEAALRNGAGNGEPALVIAVESPQMTHQEVMRLQTALPADVPLVLCVAQAGDAAASHDGLLRVRLPLSPLEIQSLSVHALQRQRRQHPHVLHGGADPRTNAARRPLVMVVDDNPVNQLVASGMLKAFGCESFLASDGQEALALARLRVPDLVLMDVQMPVMDGLQATAELRRLQARGAIPRFPIVAATAYASGADRDQCIAAGMDAFMTKPLDLPLLEDVLRRYGCLRGAPASDDDGKIT
ncbi:response regulator [Aquabacterium sp. A7-Y]|uniref:response regulator n=1 Tax=Aquabacterium sp. A7-Y TaxID=1349605 RepID=UPI00223E24F3|nr:response regulator [Aquabacterium sp. A7-Y]MCW7540650.1 response regulator [Aquabacterium sp. A7-Y]